MTHYRAWKEGCFVYFIKPVGKPGPIKIGCSQTPDARLESINAWAPYPLEMLVSISGSFELERRLHTCFSAFHSHGEWFHPSDELARGIEALKNGKPVEEAFDLSREGVTIWRLKRCKKIWTEDRKIRRGYQTKVCFAVRKLTKEAPDGVWFSEPKHISEIFERTLGGKALTANDRLSLDEFLKHPKKYVKRNGKPEKWPTVTP